MPMLIKELFIITEPVEVIIALGLFSLVNVVIMGGIILSKSIQFIKRLLKDIKQFKKNTKVLKNDAINRELISINFYTFKTEIYRKKYVEHLQLHRIEAKGEWPAGKLPNISNNQTKSDTSTGHIFKLNSIPLF